MKQVIIAKFICLSTKKTMASILSELRSNTNSNKNIHTLRELNSKELFS